MKKLPARMTGFFLPLVLSLMMSCIVSAIATLRVTGVNNHFIETWPASWALSWAVAFPVLFIVLPLARRIVHLFVERP